MVPVSSVKPSSEPAETVTVWCESQFPLVKVSELGLTVRSELAGARDSIVTSAVGSLVSTTV